MKLASIPGDGTGPEVTNEAIKVLTAVSKLENFSFDLTELDYGGERYLKTGEILPEGAIDGLREFDAVYLGAVGHPDVPPGIIERQLLLDTRFQLDQYINLRPVKLYPGVETPLAGKTPEDIDFAVDLLAQQTVLSAPEMQYDSNINNTVDFNMGGMLRQRKRVSRDNYTDELLKLLGEG